jgi:hypothetical protein
LIKRGTVSMSNSQPQSPRPRDDNAGDESGAAFTPLRRDALLAQLAQLQAAPTLASLRHAVAALHAQALAADGELLAPGPDEATSEFTRAQLLDALDQIARALTLERARYYVDRLQKGVAEVRTGPINDINLNRWKAYDDIITDSLWMIARRDSSGVHSAGYWGNYVPQIPNQMMRRYTKRGDWVLDPFAGLGTTLIEGQRLGRNTLGVELQGEVAARARALLAHEPNRHGVISELVCGDSASLDFGELLARHGQRSAQLAMLHPPYFDIIQFSDDPRDLSNAASVDAFLAALGAVVARVAEVLERRRYLALVIGDKYTKGDLIPLGFLAMNEVLRHGFALKSIVVKNFEDTAGKRAQKDLWRYRALVGGFYIFKHEYIFLFRRQ